jgi:secreted PhoX family phosphatase
MKKQTLPRRTFLEFLGKGAVSVAVIPSFLQSCAGPATEEEQRQAANFVLKGIQPTDADEVILCDGLDYKLLIRWDDPINASERFGFNNDFLAFLPDSPGNSESGLLWVNHEYTNPFFVSNHRDGDPITKEKVDKERYSVGGTFVKVKKEDGVWKIVEDQKNRRITGETSMDLVWNEPIEGSQLAEGMVGNCSGGLTPWGTILTCEENYDMFYGEMHFDGMAEKSLYGWPKFYPNPPQHYGWVVEIDPQTGSCKKHISLGRCAHECATVKQLEDGRLVVYTGDDKNDECLYKFIGSEPNSLDEGQLYVANLEAGRWESLNLAERPELQEVFDNQTDVQVYLRNASKLVGGSKLDRPEDIEIDPVTGNVLVALTNNLPAGNYYGQILKIMEKDGKYDSLEFEADTFLAGGEETGFACPDNMAFDPKGNLWFTSDISGSKMNAGEYTSFKNNGLFLVPRSGEQAGEVIQVASAPTDAEFTGPFFSPDGRTLFLSVQHPGELSDADKLTSHWPDGGEAIPRPSVITIQGDLLNHLMA